MVCIVELVVLRLPSTAVMVVFRCSWDRRTDVEAPT